MRVNVAEVLKGTRRGERERKAVVGVERLRSGKGVVGCGDAMRDVVLVGPGHRGAGLHRQLLRREGEIVDRHGGRRGLCAGDHDVAGQARPDDRAKHGRDKSRSHHLCSPQALSGESMMASRCSFCLNVTLAMPSMLRSWLSGTFIGPGDGAAPGAGCGNAVERAVWNVTLPSTFCITWWMWPLSTVTEPNFLRYDSAWALSSVPQPQSG